MVLSGEGSCAGPVNMKAVVDTRAGKIRFKAQGWGQTGEIRLKS